MSKKKIILIIILIVLILVFIWAFRRYTILNKINKLNEANIQKNNIYYYSVTNDTITEYWQKGDFIKMNVTDTRSSYNNTFWKDPSTNEVICLYNMPRIYSITYDNILLSKPQSTFTQLGNSIFMSAINPTIHISSKEYNNKDCYSITFHNQEEIIEKETGLLVFTSNNNSERKITYKFNSVTDKDVAEPDLTGYTAQ